MYTKNLTSVLHLLSVSGQSGTLLLEPSGPVDQPWQARLTLIEGQVEHCILYRASDGQVLLAQAKALEWLTALGALQWHFQEDGPAPAEQRGVRPPSMDHLLEQRHLRQFSPAPAPQPPSGRESNVPFRGPPLEKRVARTPYGDALLLNAHWRHSHRLEARLLAILETPRTIREIVILLHVTNEEGLYQLLHQLEQAGLIQ